MSELNRLGGIQGWLDRQFMRLADVALAHPRIVILIAVLFLIAGFMGAAGVRQDNSMEAYFNEADTSYAAYKSYVDEFSSDEVAYLLYAAPDHEHGIFNLEVMQRIQQLSEQIEEEMPFVRKVISLPNVEFIQASGDDTVIEDLLENFPDSQEALLEKRALALSKPLYVGTLISKDAEYGAIAIEMERTSTDPLEELRLDPEAGDAMSNLYPQVSNTALEDILARPEYAGIQFWASGDVPMNAEYNEVIEAELGILTGSTFLLVMIVALFFIRSRWLAVAAPLGIVLLSLVLTVALIHWLGWRINLMFLMVPPLLCAVGVAQALHVLVARQHQLDNGASPREAIREAILKVGTPCLLAALTTAIGFLGMSVSSLRAVHELAFYSAFGVMCAFFLSMSLLISLSAGSKEKAVANRAPQRSRMHGLLEGVIHTNLQHPKKVLGVFALLLVVAAIGLSWLRVDFNFLEEFKPDNEWRQKTEKINDVMGGLLSVVYLFDTNQADGIRNPELLKHIEKLQGIAEASPVVQDSLSIVDIVKELNQAFHGGDEAHYRLPETREAMAQLLLVYELSGGEEMNDLLNLDKSKTVLQIRLQLVGASRVREFLNEMEATIGDASVEGVKTEISGIGLLWVRMADYITSTQLKGYLAVLTAIAIAMALVFGSLKIALLGMVPNLFPIVLALGGMGWAGWNLDYFRLMLATIAIGIAVDDTIHVMAQLRRDFAHTGNYAEAVRRTLHAVGPAITGTTVILTAAFLSYLMSSMAVLASFGVLLAGTIIVALIADLFLLPVLVLMFKPFGPEQSQQAG